MWQTVCRSVGWGESSTSSAERWASVSHGPWALSGLGSCLVIGYLPDMSLRLDRTHTQTHTQADEQLDWWTTRRYGRERTNKEGWEDLIRGRMKKKKGKLRLCLRVSVSAADNAKGSQQHQSELFSSFTGRVCPLLTDFWTAPITLPVVDAAWHSHVWIRPPSAFHDDVSWDRGRISNSSKGTFNNLSSDSRVDRKYHLFKK